MASNLNSIMSTLMGSDALKGIAKSTGVDAKAVSTVLELALPVLIQGAGKQSTGSTAASFASALQSHAANDTSNLTSFFKNVDVADGAKIVGHLLGAKNDANAKDIAKKSGIDAKTVAQIMAVAAPLLMSLIGKKTTNSKKDDVSSLASALLSNVDVGSLIGSFLKK